MTFCLMDTLCYSPFRLGGKRKVLPMRSCGLDSAMGLLTDLSRSCWDLTSVVGLGLFDPTDSPKSEVNACWDGGHQVDKQ